ncbi:MAG: hypothetical protein WC547_00525 [Candidatus Omnitrophota bacterium]
MKNIAGYFTTIIIVAALIAPTVTLAQNQPDPLDQERNDVLPAYNEGLEEINQGTIDTKNAALSAGPTILAADAAVPVMPAISAPATTTANGTIVMTFTDGTLLPSELTGLWAKVTYNGKTEYWKLDPAMISADGKSFSMQFGPEFGNVTFQWQLYGFSSDGTKTDNSNTVTFTVSTPGTVTMPLSSAPAATTSGGQIAITFANPVLPAQLNGLWAKVVYDNKTEYWKLDPGMISSDGRTFTMKFDPQFDGKTMTMALFGYAASDNSQTNTSNGVTFTISSPGTITMPAITAPAETDLNRNISIGLASALLPTSLTDLWAIVKYDGKTEYWDLDPSMISTDGRTFTMQMDKSFDGKEIVLQLFGIAASDGSQTNVSNAVAFTVIAAQSAISMPALPASITADSTRTATITFTGGVLLPSQINDLWAEVKYDDKTEYWDLDPSLLNASGTAMTLQFDQSFEGKSVQVRIYAFDKQDLQTGFSNVTTITVPTTQPPSVTMPALPANITTDYTGQVTLTFTSGTLLASSLNDLWAEVKYDGKTEYWDLDPEMLAANGTSMSIQFDTAFNDKTVEMRIYGFDTQGVQTGFSNTCSILVNISATSVAMPVLPASVTTDSQGIAAITFSSGTLLASQINDLWAEVKYDGKTEYWDLDPEMLAASGTSMSIQFDAAFDGKTVQMRLYGFDTTGKQIPFSNTTSITVDISAAAVIMPAMPASVTTNATGNAVITFASGTLLASSLNDLWAEVKYDGKTEYWDLDPAILAADGKSMSIQFGSTFNGKTVAMRIYGFDKNDIMTSFSNTTTITVAITPTTVTMPVMPSNVTTDSQGTATVTFSSGTLPASSINDLWAEVKYDGKTEYWDLDPAMLAADGKSMSIQFDTPFNGKTVEMRLYGFDTTGKQTSFSNTVSILVNISATSVTMPVLPSSLTTSSSGTAAITFTSGTLKPTQLNDLWAQVQYDGKTEYWDFDPAMLNADGTVLTVMFNTEFNGKTIIMRIYGFDTTGKQTSLSNPISILVNISA